jgi:hypothetical protein
MEIGDARDNTCYLGVVEWWPTEQPVPAQQYDIRIDAMPQQMAGERGDRR